MVSPLDGIASTINSAFQNIFYNATLLHSATVYDCKAIFDKQERFLVGAAVVSSYRVLVLAKSLVVEPVIHDVLTLQGIDLEIRSDNETKPAIEIDPARAVWALRSRPLAAGSSGGGIGGNPIGIRTIAIHRPGIIAAPGATNVATYVATYSGETIATETVLYTGIQATIQYNARGMRGTAPLPADIQRPGLWVISIPLSTGIPNGAITEDDIVVDDTTPPRRYQVEAADNNVLGWRLHCRYLKA